MNDPWYRFPFLLVILLGIVSLISVILGGPIHRWELLVWIPTAIVMAIAAAFPPDL